MKERSLLFAVFRLILGSRMRAFRLVAIFLAVAVLTLSAAPPSEFRVIAHFGSGHFPVTYDDPARGAIGAWDILVDASGLARIEVIRNSPGKKTMTSVRYSRQELKKLNDTIAASRFFELPSSLDGGLTDVPSYSLEITMNGKTHRVRVSAPSRFQDKKLLKRFTSVWLAVCHKMPPKLDDGATLDLRESS